MKNTIQLREITADNSMHTHNRYLSLSNSELLTCIVCDRYTGYIGVIRYDYLYPSLDGEGAITKYHVLCNNGTCKEAFELNPLVYKELTPTMSSEQKMVLSLVGCGLALCLAICTSVSYNHTKRLDAMTEAIANGASAIEASCAFEPDRSNPLCSIYASKAKHRNK